MKTAAADATADPWIDPGAPGAVWVGCRPVTVFDIAQTTGAPTAVPTPVLPTDDAGAEGDDALVARVIPVPVHDAPRATLDNADGVWDTGRNANGIQ